VFHNRAVSSADAVTNAVVRSAGCLVTAFIALVLSTLPPDEPLWSNWLLVNHHSVEHVLSWLDAITIVFVLILYLYASGANRRWIAARVGTELLRQYQFLNVIFPDVGGVLKVDEVKAPFDGAANTIKTQVQNGPTAGIILRIERFWSERRASIESRTLAVEDVTADGLLVYLERRARRQLGWFADSKMRLEHIADRRSIVLLSFYGIAASLALVKLALFLHSGHSPAYLPPLIFIVTGMSGAMTAYYINQNARSLIHRYNMQQRRITEWLKAFNERWRFADFPSATFDTAVKTEICARILQFEDLMIEELIDWVHITSHDAFELAP
jgi:hypothetical protein